jgi:hypothetical protein
MLRVWLAGLSLLLVWKAAAAQPSAGDVAIVAYSSDTPDGFAWVALRDIPADTVVAFTDCSVSNGLFYWPEHLDTGSQSLGKGGPLLWRHDADLARGTVVRFDSSTAQWSLGTASNHYPLLSTGGDQLVAYTGTVSRNFLLPGAYQGEAGLATMLAAVDFGNAGWGAGYGPSQSDVPPGLSTGACTAVYLDGRDNGYYSGGTTGSVAELRKAIGQRANWTTSDAYLSPSLWPARFEVLPETPLFEFAYERPRARPPRFPAAGRAGGD